MPRPFDEALPARGDYAWNGIHRDAHNSDFSPDEVAPSLQLAWNALDGAAILFGPSIGPDRRRYVATGQGDGSPHLHCFSPDGALLFQSDPSGGQPSSRVCPDVPLFDDSGRFFVSDDRCVWCYDAEIKLVWRMDIQALGATAGFISTIITKEGLVGGVTMDGQVILLERACGRLARPVLQLPVGLPFAPPSSMPGLWRHGMMDPALIPMIEPGFFGSGFAVTCSPVVNARCGRIFIPIVSTDTGFSSLVALQDNGASIDLVWQAPIRGICPSSPAISPDGLHIFTVNGTGIMHGFDCDSGRLLWTRGGCGMAASPTVDENGTVYSAGRDKESGTSQILAINGTTGELFWRSNYDNVAAAQLPQRASNTLFPNSRPTAVANSVPTVTPKHILLVVNLGYDFVEPASGAKLHQPHASLLLVLDRINGTVLGHIKIRDTSEAVIVVGDDRMLHVCHAALMSSVFHYGVNPGLPDELKSPLKPVGGFTTLRW